MVFDRRVGAHDVVTSKFLSTLVMNECRLTSISRSPRWSLRDRKVITKRCDPFMIYSEARRTFNLKLITERDLSTARFFSGISSSLREELPEKPKKRSQIFFRRAPPLSISSKHFVKQSWWNSYSGRTTGRRPPILRQSTPARTLPRRFLKLSKYLLFHGIAVQTGSTSLRDGRGTTKN